MVQRRSILTCPICSYRSAEIMPVDACVWFYECRGCGATLKPKDGDCCVFCSYGSVRCPPVQAGSLRRICHAT
ncbi:GDCCVxC domain-containing (seleno)protein [Rhizobium sp. LjRoot258]|uniref:GDCCVxC domain-containing (seleno)protein n=1 Tax=Rhizobium sp. LjRoot258 TaxID=3342299 RepID=UPI003ED01E51